MPKMKEQKHERSDAQIAATNKNWTKFMLLGFQKQLECEALQSVLTRTAVKAMQEAVGNAIKEVK